MPTACCTVLCNCKSTCQRNRCPCKANEVTCTDKCKYGADPPSHARIRLVLFSLFLQVADLQRLCCRLLGSREGIYLAKSLLRPPAPDPPNQNSNNVATAGQCLPQGKTSVAAKQHVPQHLMTSTLYVYSIVFLQFVLL